jgi:signal peptidase II
MRILKDRLFIALIIFFSFIIDQASKYSALLFLNFGQKIEICKFLDFQLVFNRGISFSLLAMDSNLSQLALLGIISIATIFIFFLMLKSNDYHNKICYSLIIGGSMGNIADRVLNGAVIDFISLHACGFRFPTFNLADFFISFGTGLLFLSILTSKQK